MWNRFFMSNLFPHCNRLQQCNWILWCNWFLTVNKATCTQLRLFPKGKDWVLIDKNINRLVFPIIISIIFIQLEVNDDLLLHNVNQFLNYSHVIDYLQVINYLQIIDYECKDYFLESNWLLTKGSKLAK